MIITTKWDKEFHSIVDNGRGHSVDIDLPEDQKGTDTAPTALELSVMGLSGCIVTIFKGLADKMRIDYESMIVIVNAQKGKKTIEHCFCELRIKSSANDEKLEKCLVKTIEICPVGVIFSNAGIPIEHKITRL